MKKITAEIWKHINAGESVPDGYGGTRTAPKETGKYTLFELADHMNNHIGWSWEKEEENEMKEKMLAYLQSQLTDFNKNLEKYGMDDRIVEAKFDAMIACKEMVETLIGEPVNLRKDGIVTTGF